MRHRSPCAHSWFVDFSLPKLVRLVVDLIFSLSILTDMKTLMRVSLFANIAILVPVCTGIMMHAPGIDEVYGVATSARGILLSVYISILVCSGILLVRSSPGPVATLLLVQVFYKITTPCTVGTFYHPVVICNLMVAALHLLTLSTIYRNYGNPFRVNR
jgi:hypothetical protein